MDVRKREHGKSLNVSWFPFVQNQEKSLKVLLHQLNTNTKNTHKFLLFYAEK